MEWLKDIFLKDSEKGYGLDNWSTLSKVLGGGLGIYGIANLLGKDDELSNFLGTGGGGGGGGRPVGYQGGIPTYTARREMLPIPQDPNRRPGESGRRYFTDVQYAPVQAAQGGLMSLPESRGYYLGGPTDGMADEVPARIEGRQEARLSDGEFVVSSDVVSGLGNGNSEAGAKVLYDMMDRVRKARTGRAAQGRQINPRKVLPA